MCLDWARSICVDLWTGRPSTHRDRRELEANCRAGKKMPKSYERQGRRKDVEEICKRSASFSFLAWVGMERQWKDGSVSGTGG